MPPKTTLAGHAAPRVKPSLLGGASSLDSESAGFFPKGWSLEGERGGASARGEAAMVRAAKERKTEAVAASILGRPR